MKIQLSEIMHATISELEDLDLELSFEIEAIERQLSGGYDEGDWRKRAMHARDSMKRTKALVRTRLDKLYYGDDRLLHGAILAEIKKTMSIGKFMECVQRAKRNAGVV